MNGHIQKKNRHQETPSIWTTETFLFEKDRPGKGCRHLLSKADVLAFVGIIPDWDFYSQGLKGVRLVARNGDYDGLYYHAGIICIPAWERTLWLEVRNDFFIEHQALFDRLGVPYEFEEGYWTLKFTEHTARAYQLLHVFLHELGHHCDKMSTRQRRRPGRGEAFAENWAYEFESRVWEGYQEVFGVL